MSRRPSGCALCLCLCRCMGCPRRRCEAKRARNGSLVHRHGRRQRHKHTQPGTAAPAPFYGAFSHSARTAPNIQVTALKTTHLRNHAQSIQLKTQKLKHLMRAMGLRDLNSAPYSPVHCSSHSMTSFQSSELTELPVVENSQLFAQRTVRPLMPHLGLDPGTSGSGVMRCDSWATQPPHRGPPALCVRGARWCAWYAVQSVGTGTRTGTDRRHRQRGKAQAQASAEAWAGAQAQHRHRHKQRCRHIRPLKRQHSPEAVVCPLLTSRRRPAPHVHWGPRGLAAQGLSTAKAVCAARALLTRSRPPRAYRREGLALSRQPAAHPRGLRSAGVPAPLGLLCCPAF